MNLRRADALDEARRGLWRSAAESFAAAAHDDPDDAGLVLAEAVCHLNLGDARAAVRLLETAPGLRHVSAAWAGHLAWLRAAARAAYGDPLGAEQAAGDLPLPLWLRVVAQLRLTEGDYDSGVKALLQAFVRPGRTEAR